MMRFLSGLIFLALAAFIAWPYVRIYQLDSALNANNEAELNKLIDVAQVQQTWQQSMKHSTEQTLAQIKQGLQSQNTGPGDWFGSSDNGGAGEKITQILGDIQQKVNTIDLPKIREQLIEKAPIFSNMSFGFFESPTRFTIRIGELGQNPMFVQMNLQDWYWRVTAIYP